MQALTVNGTEIPFPDMPFTWTLNDISTEDSGRDMNGLMDKDEVAKKVTLECTWSFRSAEDTSKLLRTAATFLTTPTQAFTEAIFRAEDYV